MESGVHVVENPPQSMHSLKPLHQPHFPPVRTMRPGLQKHRRTVAMLPSCEESNKQGYFNWKLSVGFHPPPALLTHTHKKNVNKRRQQDRKRICGCGRGQGGGERGEGRAVTFCVKSVYITKEESLEHNRAVHRATALRLLSCCIFSCARLMVDSEGRLVPSPAWGLQ